MREEWGYGDIVGTVSRSGKYVSIKVRDEETKQEAMLKIHEDNFRRGKGVPSGYCAYIGSPGGGVVQIDFKTTSYFRYVSANDEAGKIRTRMEMRRTLRAIARLGYEMDEKMLDYIGKDNYYKSISE